MDNGKHIMKPTFTSYLIGFVLSILLTILAYLLVTNHVVSGGILIAAILVLALAQLIVQLLFFLHLRQGWNLVFLVSTVIIILIVVIGSIWIMNHLNYRMMLSPAAMNQYLRSQEGGI